MAEIKLTNGQVALVDEADLPKVSRWKWHVGSGGHARRTTRSGTSYMHRVIMGDPPGMHVGHINHNSLDNRRANLCIGSHVVWNRRCPGRGITRVKNGAWQAYLSHRGHKLNLGTFRDEATAIAARQYCEALLRGRKPPPFDLLWLAPNARRFVQIFLQKADLMQRTQW